MIAGLANFEPLRSRWLEAADAFEAVGASSAASRVTDWIVEADAIACERGLHSGSGAPLRFLSEAKAAPGALGGAVGNAGEYEQRVWDEGVVSCRTRGEGAVHDLHNALVWLSLPATKAALNGIHVRELARTRASAGARSGARNPASPARRSRVRDIATLLDESGVLWVSHCGGCDDALRARQWTRLFVDKRERLAQAVLALVVGHGLLHKLARPYKAITAHCLMLDGEGIAFEGQGATLAAVDRLAAAALAIPGAGVVSSDSIDPADETPALPALYPLPVMGLPGWHPENIDPAFFYDTQVFRPPR